MTASVVTVGDNLTLWLQVRVSDQHREAVLALAREQCEGNKSQALRRLIEIGADCLARHNGERKNGN